MSVTMLEGFEKALKEKYRKMLRNLTNINAESVEVGWKAESAYPSNHRNGGDYVAHIAAINEYGGVLKIKPHIQNIYRSMSQNGEFKQGARFVKVGRSNFQTSSFVEEYTINIPSRPFFRTMVLENKSEWPAQFAQMFENCDYDAKKSLVQLGQVIQGELRESIAGWTTPENAPSTVARKGFNKPLVESSPSVLSDTIKSYVK